MAFRINFIFFWIISLKSKISKIYKKHTKLKKINKKNKTRMPFHPILCLIPIPLANVIYAQSCGLQYLAASQLAIMITSILYWTRVECPTRRMLDMVIVKIDLLIHVIHCIYYGITASIILLGACMFIYKLGVHYNSNAIHSLVWLVGSISNWITITYSPIWPWCSSRTFS